MIKAHWCLSSNFGDHLTKWLLEEISGQNVAYVNPDHEQPFIVATGSILNWDMPNAIVWGAGCANYEDKIPKKKIITTRGKLTFEKAKEFKPEYYGDPALLLPSFFVSPLTEKEYQIGIVPHYVDYHIAHELYKGVKGIEIIDILQPVEHVLENILSCEAIVSSSLHGLIAADAYGIPSRWCEFSDLIGGDRFKFFDYFSTLKGVHYDYPLQLKGQKITYLDFNRDIEIDVDLQKLLQLCPVNNFQ